MNLIIERAFIMAILMSISGFVFCAIFLPFERYARKLVSPKSNGKSKHSSAAFLLLYRSILRFLSKMERKLL